MFARLGHKKTLDGLDKKLFQGLPQPVQVKDVIELYGDDGSGKTQILLHLIANCILPQKWKGAYLAGREVSVIFVDTDYHFSLLRLVEILEERITACFLQQGLPLTSVAVREAFIKSCLARLIIARCNSTEELLDTMQSFDKLLCNRTDICAMMIDSISAFYYQDKSEGGKTYYGQEKHQKKLVELLRRYIDRYYLVVVATLPAIFSKDVKQIQQLEDYSYMCRPWKCFVKYAYVVSRMSDKSSTFSLKQIKPNIGNFVVTFAIDKGGLKF